jgi:hypothetical protein
LVAECHGFIQLQPNRIPRQAWRVGYSSMRDHNSGIRLRTPSLGRVFSSALLGAARRILQKTVSKGQENQQLEESAPHLAKK